MQNLLEQAGTNGNEGPHPTAWPAKYASPRRVTVLGATGSIGKSTLDLIGRSPQNYEVVALTAATNAA